MHILITGAAGMIGRKLTERLARDGSLCGQAISALTLTDVMPPPKPTFAGRAHLTTADLADAGVADKAIMPRPTVIFHLAGVPSGGAEVDFDLGYRANIDGMRALLEAVRRAGGGYRPRLVYSSSMAVFGGPFPRSIPDEFHLTPLTSYGTAKAIAELLLADYTRRGFCEGVGLRLPAICVRPGKPNRAASGVFSSIIREPLAGEEALLTIREEVPHTHASPRAAVRYLLQAAEMPHEALGTRINLSMPGVCCTVGEQIAALRRIAGARVVARIRRAPDPLVEQIVAGWPERADARRARELGFTPEDSFDEIVRIHIEDELGGRFVA
jgi:nucleoside-diphosphate-sugar epimerase